jgi:hypothetical protein
MENSFGESGTVRIKFVCPQCAKRLKSSTQMRGKLASCPKCKAPLRIPVFEGAGGGATQGSYSGLGHDPKRSIENCGTTPMVAQLERAAASRGESAPLVPTSANAGEAPLMLAGCGVGLLLLAGTIFIPPSLSVMLGCCTSPGNFVEGNTLLYASGKFLLLAYALGGFCLSSPLFDFDKGRTINGVEHSVDKYLAFGMLASWGAYVYLLFFYTANHYCIAITIAVVLVAPLASLIIPFMLLIYVPCRSPRPKLGVPVPPAADHLGNNKRAAGE